jgi:hypothetical protein
MEDVTAAGIVSETEAHALGVLEAGSVNLLWGDVVGVQDALGVNVTAKIEVVVA